MHCPKKRRDLSIREVEQETVILDRVNNRIHKLNETGSFIWSNIDGKTTIDQLAKLLAEEYAVDSICAKHDVTCIIDELRRLDLLDSTDENTARLVRPAQFDRE